MTDEGWKVFSELMEILKDRFDDQEKRIKTLEEQLEKLIDSLEEDWIFEQMQGVREAE
jgi:chaperonin cofactor prefoldin